jgi:hypothetical protein
MLASVLAMILSLPTSSATLVNRLDVPVTVYVLGADDKPVEKFDLAPGQKRVVRFAGERVVVFLSPLGKRVEDRAGGGRVFHGETGEIRGWSIKRISPRG